MSIYIDADAFIRWEKGEFDLIGWLDRRGTETVEFPATVWQQLHYGLFAWPEARAKKRESFLTIIGAVASVAPFERQHAERAARLSAEFKMKTIGFADFQIAATVLVDRAELLSFNREHFGRVPGLILAMV
jgi:predicted nucleic acid-binding protein